MALFFISMMLFLTLVTAYEERKFGDAMFSFFVVLMGVFAAACGIALLTLNPSLGEGIAASILVIVSIGAVLVSLIGKYFKEVSLFVGAGLIIASLSFFLL